MIIDGLNTINYRFFNGVILNGDGSVTSFIRQIRSTQLLQIYFVFTISW